MVIEINCANHRSRKFLFFSRVRNPPLGLAIFIFPRVLERRAYLSPRQGSTRAHPTGDHKGPHPTPPHSADAINRVPTVPARPYSIDTIKLKHWYRNQSPVTALAWYGARPLLVVIIHDAHIFRNAARYLPPDVLPTNRSFHRDAACAGASDHPVQGALVSWPGLRSLSFPTINRGTTLYNPYCAM